MTSGVHICNICQATLEHEEVSRELECDICHRILETDIHCPNGHFICDKCHGGLCLDEARKYCETCTSRNPLEILEKTYKVPGVHLHGPEHHVLVGFALLTAAHNCGAEMEWPRILNIFQTRCAPYPGGSCCRWGCCGAAVGAGTAISVMLKTTSDSVLPWRHANALTAQALGKIAEQGGPSCCRRSSFTAVVEGAKYFAEHLNIKMEESGEVRCFYSEANTRCAKKNCLYNQCQ